MTQPFSKTAADKSPRGLNLDIDSWLRSLGLEKYEAAFRDIAVGTDILRDLTDQDLKDLGVVLGDRRRILRAIAALAREPIAQPATVVPPAPSGSVLARWNALLGWPPGTGEEPWRRRTTQSVLCGRHLQFSGSWLS